MEGLLYPDFLEKEETYEEAAIFWQNLVEEILNTHGYSHQAYLNNTTINGTFLRDGNPIFHAYIPEIDRAIRIIQEEPEEPEDLGDFGEWINETEWPDGRPLKELVISLVLTEESKAKAEAYLGKWIEAGKI